MRHRFAILALASIRLFTLQAASISQSAFDNQVLQIRQLVAGSDLRAAFLAARSLRNQAISTQELRQDFAAARKAILDKQFSSSGVLLNIQNAQDRFPEGDVRAAAQALDLAAFFLNGLQLSINASTRYASAMREVEAEATARSDAPPATLHYAARAAYDLGRYAESIELIQRELRQLPIPGAWNGRDVHVAHTLLGLDYLGLGYSAGALAELQAAANVTYDFSFVTGPSMALVVKLLPAYEDEVLAYLDKCSAIQQWPAASKALVWKQQIENGRTPDFGQQATGNLWR